MKKLAIAAGVLLISSFSSAKSDESFKPIKLAISSQSYDPRIFGTWAVKTVVVDSHCKYVEEGLKSFSKVNFSLVNGKLTPTWFGHNWDLGKNRMFKLETEDTLVWVRENSLSKNDKRWLARSKDVFNIQNHDHITAESHVNQYLNGYYAGDYKTISYMKKL